MTGVSIVGIGTASPEHSISQANSASVARRFVHESSQSLDVLPALYRMTRVARRGSVLLEAPSEVDVHQSFYPQAADADDRGPSTHERMERFASTAGQLAVESASNALRDGQVEASEITHLVTVTCTGFYAPGFDIELITTLGLSHDTQRVQVGFMGCHAIVNGLRAANAIAASDSNACVLVVAVELCSLHYQYGWDTDRVVANALFADGSGALVVRGGQPAAPGNGVPRVRALGSRLIPDTRDAMTWKIGDNGYEMTLAASVPGFVKEHLPDYLRGWLSEHGLAIEDINGWATHPGGPRILGAVQTALDLPDDSMDISRRILAQHGNMSSATLVFIIQQMRCDGVSLPWLMMGFGPGLEIELALLT